MVKYMEIYDSTKDAKEHIQNIQRVAKLLVDDLTKRIEDHDKSKLSDPEKSCYDKYIPLLKTAKYGTKEYYSVRSNMQKEGLDHHYAVNRHHPEHFSHGIDDMNLVDMIEMLCDWYAASLKSDTSFEKGFHSNCERFHISKPLEQLLWNTYNEYIKG
mgnify:CR=1 FL=1